MVFSESRCDFKRAVKCGNRLYNFHSGEEKDLKVSINKAQDFLNGITVRPVFRINKGTYFASKVILNSNNLDSRDCLETYKKLHPISVKLSQGSSNPKDRFLRFLSVWIEAGAISIKDYKIIFEPILLERLKQNPSPML